MSRPGGLAPSIISADFSRLGQQLDAVTSHASRWHVDVMDGHYVPNLTIGPMVVEAIAAVSTLPQDVHLMITNPDDTWEWYRKAGASRIAFHPETSPDPARLLGEIRSAGLGAGLAVNPDVAAEDIRTLLADVDHLVLMSVYPGFSGQSFIPEVLPKMRTLRSWIDDENREIQLIVDGGVNLDTAPGCVEAGADILVSASAIFGAEDPGEMAGRLARVWEAAEPR